MVAATVTYLIILVQFKRQFQNTSTNTTRAEHHLKYN